MVLHTLRRSLCGTLYGFEYIIVVFPGTCSSGCKPLLGMVLCYEGNHSTAAILIGQGPTKVTFKFVTTDTASPREGQETREKSD
eukprot:5267225-Amphidinium_carterae.1